MEVMFVHLSEVSFLLKLRGRQVGKVFDLLSTSHEFYTRSRIIRSVMFQKQLTWAVLLLINTSQWDVILFPF